MVLTYTRLGTSRSYIERVVRTHGWDTAEKHSTSNMVPLQPD